MLFTWLVAFSELGPLQICQHFYFDRNCFMVQFSPFLLSTRNLFIYLYPGESFLFILVKYIKGYWLILDLKYSLQRFDNEFFLNILDPIALASGYFPVFDKGSLRKCVTYATVCVFYQEHIKVNPRKVQPISHLHYFSSTQKLLNTPSVRLWNEFEENYKGKNVGFISWGDGLYIIYFDHTIKI